MRLTKWLGAAAGLFLVAGVVGFGAVAFSGTASAEEPGSKVNRFQELLAQKLGISVDKLESAQKEARNQLIDEAVQSGRITKEQAERRKNAEGNLRERLHKARPAAMHVAQNVLEDAATVIGIDATKLREELRSGKSLAEIAAANGKSRDTLKIGLEKALKEDIAQAEQNGRITAEQADRLEEGVSNRIDQIIDRKGGHGGMQERFKGGQGGYGR